MWLTRSYEYISWIDDLERSDRRIHDDKVPLPPFDLILYECLWDLRYIVAIPSIKYPIDITIVALRTIRK